MTMGWLCVRLAEKAIINISLNVLELNMGHVAIVYAPLGIYIVLFVKKNFHVSPIPLQLHINAHIQ